VAWPGIDSAGLLDQLNALGGLRGQLAAA
jgi:hypothetical protein